MSDQYKNHRTQYDGSPRQNSACVPTSLANAIREYTDGRRDFTGGWIMSQLPVKDEDNPSTPGWTLNDAAKVAKKLSIPFTIGKGGWAGVLAAIKNGDPVVLQGDSDRFPSGCSGKFDGNHCVCLYPLTRGKGTEVMLGDPICPTARWEKLSLIKAYAEKFDPGVSFAYIPQPVVAPDPKLYSQRELDDAVIKAKAPLLGEIITLNGKVGKQGSQIVRARAILNE